MVVPGPLDSPCSRHYNTDSSPSMTLPPTDYSRVQTPVHCRGEEQDSCAPKDIQHIRLLCVHCIEVAGQVGRRRQVEHP